MTKLHWIGLGLALLVGVPCALFARAHLQPAEETEHVHGGDPTLDTDLATLSGAKRLARLQEATHDSLPARRLAAAEALAHENTSDGRALAKELLTDNDSEVRLKAAYALQELGGEPERPFLRAALQDDDLWLRQEVLQWAALNAGRPNAKVGRWLIPDLVARLDETSEEQRTFATSALAKLTGKPWRYTARLSKEKKAAVLTQWHDWWRAEKHLPLPSAALPDITPKRVDPAPRVPFQSIAGQQLTPPTEGKVMLINFWGTWCAPCRQEVPDLQRLHERYASKGLTLVGVALSEKDGAESLRAWCRKNGLTYLQVLATDAILEAYGDLHEVPVTVLIDKQGRIRYRWQGERDYASYAAAIERVLT